MATAEEKVTITNETGLHARPASLFVQEAESYASTIKIIKDEQEANGKSIMGVMSLGIEQSTEVTIKAEGEDAEEAVESLVELIENQFDE